MDRLQSLLWDDDPPHNAQRTVHTYVARLRGRLKPYGIQIKTISSGYRIEVGAERVDALRFGAAVTRAQSLTDPSERAELLASALSLWRGPVLADVAGDYLRARVGTALEEQRFLAIELQAQADLDRGHHENVAVRLAVPAEENPTRERLTELLMLAYYRCGRQGDALAVYRRSWQTLRAELGVQPGPGLRELHSRILANDPSLAQTSHDIAAFPLPRFLPRDVPDFTGRARDLERLDAIVEESRDVAGAVLITTVTGTAGVGKTALAVHWGHRAVHRFPGGQLYVNLRGYDSGPPLRPVDALAHLLRALGLPGEKIPVDEQEASGLYRSLLTGRRMLVLLDNASSTEQVRPLLPASPGSIALITSRDRLGGLLARDGARRLVLDVLAPRESVALLARILGEQRVSAEPGAASALAAACGHLPLALRIAAANLADQPDRPIEGYVDELCRSDRLTALAVEGDAESMVRTAFDQSYARLPTAAARLFGLLSLVPGTDVTVEGAAALAALTVAETRMSFQHLASAHLVHEHQDGRFAMHDLIRLYAADRAAGEGVDAAHGRLCRWYLACVDAAAKKLYPHMPRLAAGGDDGFAVPDALLAGDRTDALNWLKGEQANLVACVHDAKAHGLHRLCCLLADGLRGYFYLSREMVDWQAVARSALEAGESLGEPALVAAAELSLGVHYISLGRYPEADQHYGRAYDMSVTAGWPEGAAAALGNRGVVHLWAGELPRAAEYLREAHVRQRELGSLAGQAVNQANLGIVYLTLGRLEAAEHAYREALQLHRRAGSRNSEGLTLSNLGEVLRAQGRFDEATQVHSEALEIHREVGGRLGEAVALGNIATVQRDTGDRESALESANAALALVRQTGDPNAEANILNRLASVHHALGSDETAVSLHLAALDATRRTGGREPEVDARVGLAQAYLGLGEVDQARHHGEAALELARSLGFGLLEGHAAAALARIHLRLDDVAAAVSLAEAALACQRESGARLGEEQALALLAEISVARR